MTERRPRKPSQLRERIVEESLRLFANQGYSAVSIRDIAQAAKTTNPMIYYYFGSKDELYRHILQQQIESLKARLVQAAEIEGNPVERLGSFVDAYLSFYFKNDRATFTIRELFGLGSDLYRDTVSEIDAEMRRSLRRILRDGADEGLFREDGHDMAVISILGILNTFVRRRAVGATGLRPEAARSQVLDFFLNGLRPRGETDAAIPSRKGVPAAKEVSS